jgi:uncharacterized protein involved in outer membrane biogenesis
MRLFKRLSLVLFILAVLVIGAIGVFIVTFDANQYKQQIITVVKKQTGRDLTIDGDLKLSAYPDIAIDLGRTRLSNAPGFGKQDFARVDSVQVSVEFLPLLQKQIKVAEVRLKGLNLFLHRKANGKTNWDDLAGGKGDKTKESKEPGKVVEEFMNNLSVAGVSLSDSHVRWLDEQGGQDITVSPLNLKTGVFRPGKPLPVTLSLTLKEAKQGLNLKAEGETTITLSQNKQNFTLSGLTLKTDLTGKIVPNGVIATTISGNVSGNARVISIPELKLHTNVTGDLIPQGAIDANIKGALNINLKTLQISLAGTTLDAAVNGKPLSGGKLNARVTGNIQYNVNSQKASVQKMAVDATLAGGLLKKGTARARVTGNTTYDGIAQKLVIAGMNLDATADGEMLQGGKAIVKASGDTQVALAQTHVSIPNLKINTTVTGGPVPGGKLIQQGQGKVDLNWSKKSGGVSFVSLITQLADLQLKGSNVQIQPLAARPGVSGQFQTNTFNLKKILKTLGIEPPVTSKADALGKTQAQFTLKADTDSVDLSGLKLKLDTTNINGKFALSNFARPVIRPDLSIDSINVDNYLPPSSAQHNGGKAGSSQAKPAGKGELLPVDTLKNLSIDGGLKIGKMVINKLKLSNIVTKIKARDGLIILDPANASLYKGNYKGKVTLDVRKGIPQLAMHHEIKGLRSEGLLFDLFADRYVSGNTVLVTDLTSRGNSVDALLSNLNGQTTMEFKDGTIRDSSFAQKTSLATKIFEKKKKTGDKSVVTFTKLQGDWKTDNGVFKTQNLRMLAPYFQITGKGTADIARQIADLHLRIGPKPKAGEKELFAPLRVHGPFSALKFDLELDELIKSLAKADLDKKKKELKEKLEAKKKEAKERLEKLKKEKEAELRQKLQAEKDKALKKLQDKVGNKLKEQVGDKIQEKVQEQVQEKIKEQVEDKVKENLEDKVKDQLKNKLKGLF